MNLTSLNLLFLNVSISIVVLFIDNDWLLYNSYYFYTFQFLSFFFIILSNVKYAFQFLMPSIVMLFYLSFSFALGSKFVPLGYGFLTIDFIDSIKGMKSLKYSTFYWLNIFNILFLISLNGLNKQKKMEFMNGEKIKKNYISILILIILLLLVSNVKFFGTFGLQIGLIIVLCVCLKPFSRPIKIIFYILFLCIAVIFNHENKREILMIFMVSFFMFSYTERLFFKINISNFITYSLILLMFVGLILASSILRGYGSFEVESFVDALVHIPDYISADVFAYSIIDNFEISHTYPAAILPVEYIINGQLNVKYGSTLIKPLFLPFPREIITFKPDSVISIFTSFQAPEVFAVGGSFPVAFPSEVFVNFHLVSFFVFTVIVLLFNNVYLSLFKYRITGFRFKAYLSFVVLLFILIRGGGSDLLLISYLSSLIVVIISSLNISKLRF